MSERKLCLGVVPARAGSKGIPGKNLRLLGGRPLLAYTAESAFASTLLDDVILSTDSSDIAAVGEELGLEVPFLRPPELARDDTPTEPVLRHALEELERQNRNYETICLLQPTTPFRREGAIDRAIRTLSDSAADSVVSVARIPHEYHPEWAYYASTDLALQLASGRDSPRPRRQELRTAYHRDGAIYILRRAFVRTNESMYGTRIVGVEDCCKALINLDDEDDWRRAERYLVGSSERQEET